MHSAEHTLWDRDNLFTKDTCFNPMLIYTFDLQDKDNLYRNKTAAPTLCPLFGGSTVFILFSHR